MGRRPVNTKKQPSEYPQIAFRLSKEDKNRLSELIRNVQDHLNKRRSEDAPFINKNDIFVMALEIGLKSLKK